MNTHLLFIYSAAILLVAGGHCVAQGGPDYKAAGVADENIVAAVADLSNRAPSLKHSSIKTRDIDDVENKDHAENEEEKAWITNPEGYYFIDHEVEEAATGEVTTVRNWILILRTKDNRFEVTGQLIGHNHHVCHIHDDDVEGGPLLMYEQDGALYFEKTIDIDGDEKKCVFYITSKNGEITLHDPNGRCSRSIFTAGTRISAGGHTFPIKSREGGLAEDPGDAE